MIISDYYPDLITLYIKKNPREMRYLLKEMPLSWANYFSNESHENQQKILQINDTIRKVKLALQDELALIEEKIVSIEADLVISYTAQTLLLFVDRLETEYHNSNKRKPFKKPTVILYNLLTPHLLEWKTKNNTIYNLFNSAYQSIVKKSFYYLSFSLNFRPYDEYHSLIDEISDYLILKNLHSFDKTAKHSFAKILQQYLREHNLFGYCSETSDNRQESCQKAHFFVQMINSTAPKSCTSLIKEYEDFEPIYENRLKKINRYSFWELNVTIDHTSHLWNQHIRNSNPNKYSAIENAETFQKWAEKVRDEIQNVKNKIISELTPKISSVVTTKLKEAKKPTIVSIYALKDKEEYFEKLMLQCHSLKDTANFWDREKVQPGDIEKSELESALKKANIILLFLSSSLFEKYPHNILGRTLQITKSDLSTKINNKKCKIIPVKVNHVAHLESIKITSELAITDFMPIPQNTIIFDYENKDEIFAKIAERLKKIIRGFKRVHSCK